MSALGIEPARITTDAEGLPFAPGFGDRYHPRAGAAAQARHVFLAGNRLPARWAGRDDFTILETGFGLGHNFLATWQAWRGDPQRCARLHYVGIDAHPPGTADLARLHDEASFGPLASALRAAWPAPWAGLHALEFDEGRVRLLLAFGDVDRFAATLDLGVDAYFLDGFAPDRNPAMWSPPLLRRLAGKARAGATAATWSVARPVVDALRGAGFAVERRPGLGDKREVLAAVYAAPFTAHARQRTGREAESREALVLGAGLAGAWTAHALARRGWRVRVLDRHRQPAGEASGNAAGIFHGTVHADGSTHAVWNLAAAACAARRLRPWIGDGSVPGQVQGLLRMAAADDTVAAMRARLAALGLPQTAVQALDGDAARRRAGLAPDADARPAWWFADGGWVDPAALTRRLLDGSGIGFEAEVEVASIRRDGAFWQLLDARGHVQRTAPVLVIAAGVDSARLWPGAAWPLGRDRGQTSIWSAPPDGMPRPRLPLAGDGYAIALPDGRLLAGATAHRSDASAALRDTDHGFNRERVQRLLGSPVPPPDDGRVGWRAPTTDRLPIVGPVATAQTGGDWRRVERVPGLYVLGGLGSRGLTWAPLASEVLAAWICGTPMPVERRLRDAIDPARWTVRAARRVNA